MRRVATLISLSLVSLMVPTFTAAQNAPSHRSSSPEAQKCAALSDLKLPNQNMYGFHI
jgi:hypothetical protein